MTNLEAQLGLLRMTLKDARNIAQTIPNSEPLLCDIDDLIETVEFIQACNEAFNR